MYNSPKSLWFVLFLHHSFQNKIILYCLNERRIPMAKQQFFLIEETYFQRVLEIAEA